MGYPNQPRGYKKRDRKPYRCPRCGEVSHLVPQRWPKLKCQKPECEGAVLNRVKGST